MEALDCIKSRRTIRKFTEQPIEFEKLGKILEAGSYAPSAGNIQNFRFILVTEKGLIKQLYDHCLQQEVVFHAQVCIVICGEDDKAERMYGLRGRRLYSIQNCAAAAQNMLLAAHDLGLGACWIGAFDEDKIRSLFDIEEQSRPQAIIALGYPDEHPPAEKKDLQAMTHFNAYGLKVKDVNQVVRDYSRKWEKGIEGVKDSSGSIMRRLAKWMEERKKRKAKKKKQ